MDVGWALPVLWVSLGATVVGTSIAAARSHRAYVAAVLADSVLFVLAGAGANAYFLLRGDDFSGFADGASTDFVRDTWESLVVPHHHLFIGLLVLFEALVGVLVLAHGRPRQTALALQLAFTVALVSFGWTYLVWAVPIGFALVLLRRAGHGAGHPEPIKEGALP